MARQSIPRFDLYGELGVDPSADDEAIEAAYWALVERIDPGAVGADDGPRLARLKLARQWLTDSERRSRYDASRSRAARRSASDAPASRKSTARRAKAATAAAGLTTVEAAEAEATAEAEAAEATAEAEAAESAPTGLARTAPYQISWPAVDLDRSAPEVVPRRSGAPPGRIVVGVIAAVVAVVAFGAYVVSRSPAPTEVAVASPTSPTPTETIVVATPSPSPEPTIAVTTPPATPVGPDFAAMQQAAWDTIQALAAAAAAGDVATAQTMLGDSAPGLRASGLKRAVFPDVEVADISVTQSGGSYLAAAGTDLLTSLDGITWTFDYADRPLRLYRSPAAEPVHDLYWIEGDGRHHIYLRVAWATVSTSGVTVKVAWSFDPSRPDDASYFRRSELVISSVTLDASASPVTAAPMPMFGATTLTATATFTGVGDVPQRLGIGITITNPRAGGGSDRAIESIFKLDGR